MKNSGICKNNIFQYSKLPGKKDKELFENIFSSDNILIERIISSGWNKIDDKWYDQEKDEWVILLKGFATIEFEKNKITELVEGDYLFIPTHCKHKVTKSSSKPPCIWLTVHF